MIYAKKKIQGPANFSVQNAKIIENVNVLKEKNLLRVEGADVYVYPAIWKDQATALNWIKCIHIYCILKHRFKEKDPLNVKDFETGKLIGTIKNKRATILWAGL